MTRAGLEPATYGLKERMFIKSLASSSIAKLCLDRFFAGNHRSVRFAQLREESLSYGFFRGSISAFPVPSLFLRRVARVAPCRRAAFSNGTWLVVLTIAARERLPIYDDLFN
jgi:hypothetical protein